MRLAFREMSAYLNRGKEKTSQFVAPRLGLCRVWNATTTFARGVEKTEGCAVSTRPALSMETAIKQTRPASASIPHYLQLSPHNKPIVAFHLTKKGRLLGDCSTALAPAAVPHLVSDCWTAALGGRRVLLWGARLGLHCSQKRFYEALNHEQRLEFAAMR
jgi:hypothetical protein